MTGLQLTLERGIVWRCPNCGHRIAGGDHVRLNVLCPPCGTAVEYVKEREPAVLDPRPAGPDAS